MKSTNYKKVISSSKFNYYELHCPSSDENITTSCGDKLFLAKEIPPVHPAHEHQMMRLDCSWVQSTRCSNKPAQPLPSLPKVWVLARKKESTCFIGFIMIHVGAQTRQTEQRYCGVSMIHCKDVHHFAKFFYRDIICEPLRKNMWLEKSALSPTRLSSEPRTWFQYTLSPPTSHHVSCPFPSAKICGDCGPQLGSQVPKASLCHLLLPYDNYGTSPKFPQLYRENWKGKVGSAALGHWKVLDHF